MLDGYVEGEGRVREEGGCGGAVEDRGCSGELGVLGLLSY